MINSRSISFHEATVVRFCRCGDALELELEDVLVAGVKSRAVLKISPVVCVRVDGMLPTQQLMELDDGEVLSLETSEDGVLVIIEWNDFSQKKSVTRSYQISGSNISISVENSGIKD